MGLREPQTKDQYLEVIDQFIHETFKIEQRDGIYAFLMPCAKARPHRVKPVRSLCIHGELALMMGARRMVQEEPAYRPPMTEWLNLIEQRWRTNPLIVVIFAHRGQPIG